MDECSGDVLPFPREVASGLKTIAVGLNVAFLLAGLSHAFITQTKQDRRNILNKTSAFFSLVLTVIAHVVSIAESVKHVSDDRLWTYVTNDSFRYDPQSFMHFCLSANILLNLWTVCNHRLRIIQRRP